MGHPARGYFSWLQGILKMLLVLEFAGIGCGRWWCRVHGRRIVVLCAVEIRLSRRIWRRYGLIFSR